MHRELLDSNTKINAFIWLLNEKRTSIPISFICGERTTFIPHRAY